MTRAFPLTLTILVPVLALAGCSGSGPAGNSSSSFDKGFVDSFRPKFITQCQAGAKQTSGSDKDFSVVCGCVADKLIANKSVGELMTGPSQEDTKRYADECMREHPVG
jgi:hypothetical protein